MNLQELFGKRVRELRQKQELSQEALAFKAGIDRTYMTSIENGKRNVSIQNIEKVITALDVPVKDFFASDIFIEGKK
ncbi:helix-turn-helix domain-containing protein [Carboxylicivirga marina]|uniref:Helix-turn-helix transcriptional regulator n=1 Tax=Carboxylicivirga marina TaxID=2800988 RepID=A0ABS1HLM3_9BACT|nr:helix-turn-helix transcriptional regulator [Carboxylicivirga marina]MBK3518579.1 helix-turn-helix transcriptional regulator [Carboxylicivirga marina]